MNLYHAFNIKIQSTFIKHIQNRSIMYTHNLVKNIYFSILTVFLINLKPRKIIQKRFILICVPTLKSKPLWKLKYKF